MVSREGKATEKSSLKENDNKQRRRRRRRRDADGLPRAQH